MKLITDQDFSSEDFEKLIKDLEEMLNASGAKIIHNEKIRDPDSGTLRQVDIMIRRGDSRTHIECRYRTKPQDVQWIEELIGKKISLDADEMIGVSCSGFTSTAIIKAKSHNIVLRDIRDLLDVDIYNWGSQLTVDIRLAEIKKLDLALIFKPPIRMIPIRPESMGAELKRLGAFELIINKIVDIKSSSQLEIFACKFNIFFEIPVFIAGVQLLSIETIADLNFKLQRCSLPKSFLYRDLSGLDVSTLSIIETMESPKIRAIRSEQSLKTYIDMATINIPPNCFSYGMVIGGAVPGMKGTIGMANLGANDFFESIGADVQIKFEDIHIPPKQNKSEGI